MTKTRELILPVIFSLVVIVLMLLILITESRFWVTVFGIYGIIIVNVCLSEWNLR